MVAVGRSKGRSIFVVVMLLPSTLELASTDATGLCTVRWLADSPPAALQSEYEALLGELLARQSARWLFDIRCRPVPDMETANWVALNWLPRAAAQVLTGPLRVAYLISPERAAHIASDPHLLDAVHDALAPNRRYLLALFGDENTARRWLLA